MNKVYQTIIVGAGPAGITAAIYLKRAGIDFLIFEKYLPGGKVNLTAEVENYPSFNQISGPDLAQKMIEQLDFNQIEINYFAVEKIEKENDLFIIKSEDESFLCQTVILATGTKERKLGIEKELEFENRGVSQCAICDGPLYKNQDVAVIGGGNSALEESLYLSSFCSKVYLIHRRDEFRADQILIDLVKKNPKIEIKTPFIPLRLEGEQKLQRIIIKDVAIDKEETLDIAALFPYIGAYANTDLVTSLSPKVNKGYLVVDDNLMSSIPGLFVAGDCIDKQLRQIATAVGDGAIAANSIGNYLRFKSR